MNNNRREFLKFLSASSAMLTSGLAGGFGGVSAFANSQGKTPLIGAPTNDEAATLFSLSELRGSTNANKMGLMPGVTTDQGKILQSILDIAAKSNKPVFLPPGDYLVSNIVLPKQTRLMGVPGASRLIYSGGGHFFVADKAEHIELTGLSFDGANRDIAEYADAAIRLTRVKHCVIDNCRIVGSAASGVRIDRSSGRIERSLVSGAKGGAAIYTMENKRFSILNNQVLDCSNGGILVHRWKEGDDGTIISGNRIANIAARMGGTGQLGNGINIFRADNVIVTGNHVSNCALSAIRSNAGDNIQITNNTCLKSGETAIYSEFGFNGAMINNNIVDGGAVGISIANLDHGGRLAVCSGNLIRNITNKIPYDDTMTLYGCGIACEAETAVTGNVIENTHSFGMLLGWGPYLRNVVAASNIIRKTRTGICVSVVEGAGSALISANTIVDVTDGAIIGYAWDKKITGDLAAGHKSGKSEADKYKHLTIERNRVS